MADTSTVLPRAPERGGFPTRDQALEAYFARWRRRSERGPGADRSQVRRPAACAQPPHRGREPGAVDAIFCRARRAVRVAQARWRGRRLSTLSPRRGGRSVLPAAPRTARRHAAAGKPLPVAIDADAARPVSHRLRPPGFRHWTRRNGSCTRHRENKDPMRQLTPPCRVMPNLAQHIVAVRFSSAYFR